MNKVCWCALYVCSIFIFKCNIRNMNRNSLSYMLNLWFFSLNVQDSHYTDLLDLQNIWNKTKMFACRHFVNTRYGDCSNTIHTLLINSESSMLALVGWYMLKPCVNEISYSLLIVYVCALSGLLVNLDATYFRFVNFCVCYS